jgi:hypothetical protein
MGAKLKSKTHLRNAFFDVFEPFCACLASKFSKNAKMTKKNFFAKFKKDIKKSRISR